MAEESRGVEAAGFGEIIAEVDTGRNDALLWGPTGDRLRGRFDAHNFGLGETSDKGLMNIPPIPGHHIHLNPRARTARIFDPLAAEELAPLLKLASEKHRNTFLIGFTPVDPVERENMPPDEVATWLYWLMRHAKAKQIKVVRGSVPESEEEILRALKGAKIRKACFAGQFQVENDAANAQTTPHGGREKK